MLLQLCIVSCPLRHWMKMLTSSSSIHSCSLWFVWSTCYFKINPLLKKKKKSLNFCIYFFCLQRPLGGFMCHLLQSWKQEREVGCYQALNCCHIRLSAQKREGWDGIGQPWSTPRQDTAQLIQDIFLQKGPVWELPLMLETLILPSHTLFLLLFWVPLHSL